MCIRDSCGAGQELNLEEEKRYTEIRKAIDNLGCGHVSMNICRWACPGTWARNIARSWRISADIRPEWGSVKYIINKNLYQMCIRDRLITTKKGKEGKLRVNMAAKYGITDFAYTYRPLMGGCLLYTSETCAAS